MRGVGGLWMEHFLGTDASFLTPSFSSPDAIYENQSNCERVCGGNWHRLWRIFDSDGNGSGPAGRETTGGCLPTDFPGTNCPHEALRRIACPAGGAHEAPGRVDEAAG